MRTTVALIVLVLCSVLSASPSAPGELEWFRWRGDGDIHFGGSVDEMHSVRIIASEDGTDRRIVYGDRHGLIRAVRFRKRRFQEEWTSRTLRGPVAEVFVVDVDGDGKLEIVAYSELGDIVFYRAEDYKQIWRSNEDEFDTISAMVVENVDDDPQLELVFCAETVADVAAYRPMSRGSQEDFERQREEAISRLFVYDCLNLFVEWNSEQGLSAQSIAVGDLDADGVLEIALNTGFIVDSDFRRVQWHLGGGFGQKIGYADVDGDGIPELIGEFVSRKRPRRMIRIYDVDLQTESFLSKGR